MNRLCERTFWFGVVLTLSMMWAVVIVETRLYVLYDRIVFSAFGAVGLVIAFGAIVFDELQYRQRKKKYREQIMIDEELEPVGSWGSDPDLSSTAKEV